MATMAMFFSIWSPEYFTLFGFDILTFTSIFGATFIMIVLPVCTKNQAVTSAYSYTKDSDAPLNYPHICKGQRELTRL